MSATAALSSAAVGSVVAGDQSSYAALTATLAITVGVIALVFGLARLGFIANFISEPVLKGFIIGLAMTIMIGQVPKLLGVEKGSGDFFDQLWHILGELGEASGWTVLVGGVSLVMILALRRWASSVPGSLVVVAGGIFAAKAANLSARGVELVGHIPRGLPHYGLPSVPVHSYLSLAGSGVGIVLVGFAEGLAAAKTYAARDRYDIDANRELIGLGAANAASGLSSGMVVNGSLSKTAVNGGAGARTQGSGLIVALLTILTLLFLTGLFEDLPEATLAAVVIAAVLELVDVERPAAVVSMCDGTSQAGLRSGSSRRFHGGYRGRPWGHGLRHAPWSVHWHRGFRRAPRLPGVASACGRTRARPGPSRTLRGSIEKPGRHGTGGIVILRVESPLFFANVDGVETAVRVASVRPGVRAVVLDAETMAAIDVTAADMLEGLADRLEAAGVQSGHCPRDRAGSRRAVSG